MDQEQYPVRIRCTRGFLDELARSEEGSYEDVTRSIAEGHGDDGRPLESHAHAVARRHKTVLVVRNKAEAEDVYYAVCSGSAQRTHLRSCKTVADILRPLVSEELARRWPYPTGY